MDHECEGSGRELPDGPPPDRATACPVCGREIRVDTEETANGSSFVIGRHQKVTQESP